MTADRKLLAKCLLFRWCLVAVSATVLMQPAMAVPVYDIVPLGLDDLEHIRYDGYKYSTAQQLNDAGQVVGYSNRYNGSGRSAWLYNGASTINIGLTGSEHTHNDGYKYSDTFQLNEAGQVVGYSNRYNGGGGRSAWLYNGTATINIGLSGSEHTRSDGFKNSDSYQLNEAGQVHGRSERYNGGSTFLGYSAWLYDGTATIDIGLTGIEHTRNDRYKFSDAVFSELNEAGQVRGRSTRYNGGNTQLGQTAWLYDGTTTIDIGFTGSEHTRNDGYKFSEADKLNEAGQVSGRSLRFNNSSTYLGNSAWLYDGATTIDIGLVGSEYTRNDGFKLSIAVELNEAGQVVGYSWRYNGGNTLLGYSAWLYDGATTIAIGLTDSEHTRNDGYKYSVSSDGYDLLNEAGHVLGEAERYNGGSTYLGQSVWLYDGATTIAIGLTGGEHTQNDGYKFSHAHRLNETGQVVGYSLRYNDSSTLLGWSVWLYDGATTIDIGLAGSEHTRNDGYKYSEAEQLNEAGQVRGFSERYNGGSTQLGQDAWLYDQVLDQTFALNLSTRSDGYAYSHARYLGEDGLVLGTYTLFDALDNDLGDRAFYFTIADGLHDLGSLVEGGLAANSWDRLANAIRANGLGQILGQGKLNSQSGGQMAYLLTPVPEPNSVLLAGLATLLATFLVRRRRQ